MVGRASSSLPLKATVFFFFFPTWKVLMSLFSTCVQPDVSIKLETLVRMEKTWQDKKKEVPGMLYCISLSTSCRQSQSERRHQRSSLTHPTLHYPHQQPCSGAAWEEGPAAPSPGRLWSRLHIEQPSPARSLSLAKTAGPGAHHEPGILRVQLGRGCGHEALEEGVSATGCQEI